jgi:hypothetical protein
MDQVKFVDERIAAAKQRLITAGTATTSTDMSSNTVSVVFHGSTQSVPVKSLGNLTVRANDRVVLMKVEADWVVIGTFSRGMSLCQVADPATRDVVFSTTTPPGQQVYTVSTGELEMWNGTAWLSMMPRIIYKPSETLITNDSTLNDDPHLFAWVEAHAVYRMKTFVSHDTGTIGDIKTAYTYPSGTVALQTAGAGYWMGHLTTDDTAGTLWAGGYSITDNPVPAGGRTGAGIYRPAISELMFKTADVAGLLKLQWAQDVAEAASTAIGAGSYIELWKIGAN